MSLRTLYARVGEDAHAWVASQAAGTGLSQSDIVNLVITEAMRLGWEIRQGPAARVEHRLWREESRAENIQESPAAALAPAPAPRDQVPGIRSAPPTGARDRP